MNLELDRAAISECGMEPAFVVHLVDEVRKRVDDVGERLVAADVDFLGLDGLYEALGLGVVIGIAAPAHGTGETMLLQDGAIVFGGILRPTVGMMHATSVDCGH